jgi:hypothetical protein
MTVSVDKITRGLANFVDGEIVGRMPMGTVKRTLVGTAMGLYISNLDKAITGVQSPIISALGIFDADGGVDIDRVAEEARKNIPDSGVKVDLNVIGFHIAEMTLGRGDIDLLRSYIINA